MHRVLLVEDNPETRILVKACLDSIDVVEAESLEAGRTSFAAQNFDLLILDLELPDGNGTKFLAELQANEKTKNIPVFILTGKRDTMEKILAFSVGADDFITKPFDPLELKARVQAKLRKIDVNLKQAEEIFYGDVKINIPKQRVWLKGATDPLSLTSIEYRLLLQFVRNPDRIISREKFLDEVWGTKVNVTDRTVDTHIGHLRKKLRGTNLQIETVVGEGYRLKE